jgi:hypothetical protein
VLSSDRSIPARETCAPPQQAPHGAGVGGLRFELMANAVVTESAISKKLSLQAKRQV